MKDEASIKAEMNAVAWHRIMLAGNAFRLKMFILKPLSKFLAPLLKFAHFMGQVDMAKWILETDDARLGFTDDDDEEDPIWNNPEESNGCPQCGTPLKMASGIGPYCPTKDCPIIDNAG